MTTTIGYSTLDEDSVGTFASLMTSFAEEAARRAVRIELTQRGFRLFRHAIVAHQMAVVVTYRELMQARYPEQMLTQIIDAMEAQQP